MVGRQFAHYVVLGQAGAGAMGVVYRARDESLQRDVALKLPAEGAVLTEELRAKWLAEARAASALNHPNICTIYEVGEFEGQPYIAMEYLAGRPLNECIPRTDCRRKRCWSMAHRSPARSNARIRTACCTAI